MPQHNASGKKCWLTDDPDNKVVNTAWTISKDLKFLALLKAENGLFTADRKHNIPYWRNGKQHWDWGLCGISDYYYPEIVNDKRFFTDIQWQLEACYQLYVNGTVFYGSEHIPVMKLDFTCS